MNDDVRMSPESAADVGRPTWLRVLQAALIGIVAGLALHAILSIVVLRGEEPGQGRPAPSQCKKSSPARDAAAPREHVPRISGVGVYMPRALDGGTMPFNRM